jgi:hypothetical protein
MRKINARVRNNSKNKGMAVAGEHCGREADFSTAPLAKARAASVEMTVLLFEWEKEQTTANATAKAGALRLVDGLHPTHRRVRDEWGTRAFVA